LAYSFDLGNFERGIHYFKVSHFYPPLLFSPTNVIFLILEGLPCQMKLKTMLLILSDKFSGKIRLELLKMNFDKAKVLTIYFAN